VFPKYKSVIFVHGCFWHRHEGCKYATTPKDREEFWLVKFKANMERDRRNIEVLEKLGWRVLVVWECELKVVSSFKDKIYTVVEWLVQQ
jgi:DNA mismatch endonuclease (patch repair protein)